MADDLIERARAGDVDAFEELARSRLDAMYRLAVGITGDTTEARDVAQEALVAMWRGLPSLRALEAFDGWLFRITLNAAKMALRRRSGVRELQLAREENDLMSRADTSQPSDFNRAFERLTVEQRALLLRHHLDGMTVAALADLLEVPEGTVKSRLHTARAALERALERERR